MNHRVSRFIGIALVAVVGFIPMLTEAGPSEDNLLELAAKGGPSVGLSLGVSPLHFDGLGPLEPAPLVTAGDNGLLGERERGRAVSFDIKLRWPTDLPFEPYLVLGPALFVDQGLDMSGLTGVPPDPVVRLGAKAGAAWSELATGWPVEVTGPWLAAEAGRVTPHQFVTYVADHRGWLAAATWLRLTGDEERSGYTTASLAGGEGGRDGTGLPCASVVMPGTTGVDLAHEARELRPGLKVLLTSGFADFLQEDGTPAPLPGPLLSKPYRRQDLARALRALIEGAG